MSVPVPGSNSFFSSKIIYIYIYIHLHIYPGSHVHVPDFVETLTFAVVLPRMIQGDGVSQ